MLRMEKLKFLVVLCICSMFISFTAFNVHATIWEIQKNISLYGNLDQHDLPDNGSMACGPSAAINSFAYLENQYPGIYGDNLIPGDNSVAANLISAATTLAGPAYMNTTHDDGTYWDDFIYGKWQYIEERASGSTIFNAQANDSWSWSRPPVAQPGWVDSQRPTWNFIYEQLVACEDLEILLSYFSGGGHYLTLTSFYFDDIDDDGFIDDDETASLDYIDPWFGTWGQSVLSQGAFLELGYGGGGRITMAVSESPVPEASTLILLVTGLLGLAGHGRKTGRSKPA